MNKRHGGARLDSNWATSGLMVNYPRRMKAAKRLRACGGVKKNRGFLNWAVSVEAPIAVVEAVPPVTATVTASQ
jgi:hypothetical protein